MNKFIGYILSFVGVIGLAVTYEPVNKALGNIIASSLIMTATIVSVALLIIGIVLISKSSEKKIEEVPIYHGKDIVGFRRIHKK